VTRIIDTHPAMGDNDICLGQG